MMPGLLLECNLNSIRFKKICFARPKTWVRFKMIFAVNSQQTEHLKGEFVVCIFATGTTSKKAQGNSHGCDNIS